MHTTNNRSLTPSLRIVLRKCSCMWFPIWESDFSIPNDRKKFNEAFYQMSWNVYAKFDESKWYATSNCSLDILFSTLNAVCVVPVTRFRIAFLIPAGDWYNCTSLCTKPIFTLDCSSTFYGIVVFTVFMTVVVATVKFTVFDDLQ